MHYWVLLLYILNFRSDYMNLKKFLFFCLCLNVILLTYSSIDAFKCKTCGSIGTIVSISGLAASIILIVMLYTLTKYLYLLVGSSLIFASFSIFLQIDRFIESHTYCPTCIIVTIIFDIVFVGLTFFYFHFENLIYKELN